MIVDELVALKRIRSKDNLINLLRGAAHEPNIPHESHQNDVEVPSNVIIKPINNTTGPKSVPPIVQNMIKADCILGKRQEDAAQEFGLVQSTVSNYVNSRTEGTRSINSSIEDIHIRAVEAMVLSIDKVRETIPNVKRASEASVVAANLSRVIEKTSRKEATTNVKVVLYSPRIKEEAEYIEVEVG